MSDNLYDVIIMGSGPAGLSAAIYAVRAKLKMLVLERAPMSGGQIINTYEVDNYPGLLGINGFDLAVKFREHCEKLKAEFMEGEVISFEVEGEIKVITLQNGTKLYSKSVIIATGAMYRKLGVPGEEKYTGMGISYCATCDGAFFKNKVVAVIGGGDVAVEDAIFLARLCKKVYVIHRREEFRAAKVLSEQLMALENVTILWNRTVSEIQGDEAVTGLRLYHKKEEKEELIEINGVFIAVGNQPNTEVFKSIIDTDEYGYLKAGEDCKTNISGVFAAGDVRTKVLRQVITAAADGAVAITGVERYLNGQ